LICHSRLAIKLAGSAARAVVAWKAPNGSYSDLLHYFFPQIPQIAKRTTIAAAASTASVFH